MSQLTQAVKDTGSNAAVSDPASTQRRRILLVEGDGFTRLVLLLRLRLAGFIVDFTSNGSLGLGKVRTCRPDILLVELKLCGLSGLALIKAARAEAGFGDRPIYVFTHADRMNRATRKELNALSVELLDKKSVTREDLVQIFTGAFLKPQVVVAPDAPILPESPSSAENQAIVPGAIEALVQGVAEQWQVLLVEPEERPVNGEELLSRVSSLASCAEAAGLADLARQARALENLLQLLCKDSQAYSDSILHTIARTVEVMIQMPFDVSAQRKEPRRFKSLLIDESPESNRIMKEALLKACFDVGAFEEPGKARAYLNSNRASVIIANLALPEAHGLSASEVRHLPLHTGTHIVYGPERPAGNIGRDELPLRGARLDKSPVSVAELVLTALNLVQAGTARSSPAVQTATVASMAANPVAGRAAAAVQAAEDGFDLFAIPSSAAPAIEHGAGPQPQAGAHAVNQPTRLNALFASSGIPSQPILRAEEEHGNDTPLMESPRLPAFSPDGFHNDEEHLEAAPLTDGRMELPLTSEEEIQSGDGSVINAGIEPATTEDIAAFQPNSIFAQSHNNHATVAQVALEPEAPNGELMSNHLQAFAEQRAQARCAELEQEVAALRQAFEGLNGGFGEQTSSAPANEDEIKALEEKLNEATTELERAREDQQQIQDELKRKLEEATAANEQHETARQQAEARSAELQHQLAQLRQEKETALNKAAEKAAASSSSNGASAESNSGLPASELEQQVRQGVAALAKATAELAKERGERLRSQQLAADLNGRLQTLHQDFTRTLQSQGEHLARITALEQQHDQSRQALERCTAELEQQEAERRSAEEQLHKAKELNAQLRKDLSFFDQANKKFDGSRQELQLRLAASLNAVKEHEARSQHEKLERQRLAQNLEQTQAELQDQVRKAESLAQELQSTREALQDREARLQKEAAERQRLGEALATLPSGSGDHSDRDLEFSKVQSALQMEQVERKRQESQLARMRQSALDAAHAARSLRNSMRRQIREPVDNLVQSTRSLLELEMGEEHKKLAEAVLQDVLLVQTRLRDPALAQSDTAEQPAPNSNTP
jgi:CheY-like chemotaxis protein